MATEAIQDPPVETAPPEESAPVAGGGRFDFRSKKFKILVLLVLVMAVEAAAIYLLLPAPADKADDDGIAAGTQAGTDIVDVDSAEVEIDSFHCTNNTADPTTTIHVDFQLVAVVSGENQAAFDQAVNTDHKARVRQAIITVVRDAKLEDLNDSDLTLIKKRIREEVNKVLGQSYVNEVVISKWQTLGQ